MKNTKIASENNAKAERAYTAYKEQSLFGRLSRNSPDKPKTVYSYSKGAEHTGYDPRKSKYSNLSEMNSTRRELKKRQRKEKAKALVYKILGRRYNSSPANSQKLLQTESFVREQFVREKKIKEKKIKEKKK